MTLTAARPRLIALAVLACLLTLPLPACSHTGPTEENTQSSLPLPPSTQLRMSGEYVMNEDGTLQQPTHTTPLPTLDPKALEYTPDGAELAARHFLALTEYAWATGDSTPMRAFFTPECEPCTHMADRVDKMYSSGGWMTGGAYQVEEVIRVEEIPEIPHTFGVQFTVQQSGNTQYVEKELQQINTNRIDLAFFLHWNDGSWEVTGESSETIS